MWKVVHAPPHDSSATACPAARECMRGDWTDWWADGVASSASKPGSAAGPSNCTVELQIRPRLLGLGGGPGRALASRAPARPIGGRTGPRRVLSQLGVYPRYP